MTEVVRRLTARGAATREKIVAAAAQLFYEQGVRNTGNEDIRREAGVSGSQLNHFFATREDLVRAVLARRTAEAADPQRIPGLGRPATRAALRDWADEYVDHWRDRLGGCRVGSIAAETLKSGFALDEDVAGAFEQWRAALEAGLVALRENGELAPDADVGNLALVLLASLQGGLFLTQALRDVAPLEAALGAALEAVDRAGPV
ncbi:TetR/AcrR family transcriptional regulator [Actinomycetospora sp. NBRC 106378]|uniref:TetR/AcrR family transcriptional regulator n=1 Tax=Actinomycetospora sp. NBRC 106378 TaxID=3032208 RepID=UPI0024A0318F|nr:TetR/AcrR family transcriptional regulator [Actinomycetospora sp. NBRC 106378]GLZ52130.1 putative transcriptional regulator, TetR family protein [Actinomycetospora sp. NBRC 106378]